MKDDRNHYAVFAPDMAGGGAERAALQLAAGLAEEGHRADLVLANAVGPRMDQVPPTVNLVDLGAGRVLTSLPRLIRYLRREKPDAMASVLDHANIVAIWARRIAGVPPQLVVVEQNNLTEAAGHGKSRRDRIMPRLVDRFYPSADVVACVSKGVADDLSSLAPNIPSDLIRVIHNPIVTPEIHGQAALSPEHHWFDSGLPVFVAAGRLRPQKDFPTLIDAFTRLRKDAEARLVILGEGPERDRLQHQIDELGMGDSIELHGHTANPYAFFAAAAAFVLSSRWEGLPTVLIEALACGAPIIATDCPSGPREILEDGRYGRLLPVADVGALAEAMASALRGEIPPPPPESWHPYQLQTVVDDYLKAFSEVGE